MCTTKDPEDVRSVAWAFTGHAPLEPLVVFSGSRILYIFNVKQQRIVGRLRGHGGVSVNCGEIKPTRLLKVFPDYNLYYGSSHVSPTMLHHFT
jgi:hypothetical protein